MYVYRFWILYLLHGVAGIYFVRENYNGVIAVPSQAGARILHMTVLSSHLMMSPPVIHYLVTQQQSDACLRPFKSTLFQVDVEGWLYVLQPIVKASSHQLTVLATVPVNLTGEPHVARTDVRVDIIDDGPPCGIKSEYRRMCQGNTRLEYRVDTGYYTRLELGSPKSALCPNITRLYWTTTAIDAEDTIITHNMSLTPLDKWMYITCSLNLFGNVIYVTLRALIQARYVSRHVPVRLDQNNDVIVNEVPGGLSALINVVFTDMDKGKYLVRLEGDKLHLLTCNPLTNIKPHYLIIPVNVTAKVWPTDLTTYKIKVIITDTTYVGTNASSSLDPQITSYLTYTRTKLPPTKPDVNHPPILYRTSSMYTRVTQVIAGKSNTRNYLLMSSQSMFAITQQTGIIYLNNTNLLLSWKPSFVKVLVTFNQGGFIAIREVTVDIEDPNEKPVVCKELHSCARHSSPTICERSCGVGAVYGHCVMRSPTASAKVRKTRRYGTCSPTLSTCPDRQCDELEVMYPRICPQDCTVVEPRGEALLNSVTQQGITLAKGTCICAPPDSNSVEFACHCDPWHNDRNSNKSRHPPSTVSQPPDNTTTYIVSVTRRDACDDRCKNILLSCTGLLLIVIILGTATYKYRSRCNRKYVHSISSMPVSSLHSEYLTEESNTAPYSVYWSPMLPRVQDRFVIDDKWEFPRKKLRLSKVLGEGEFGLVVRGTAVGIHGGSDVTPVAVKMVKNCGTRSDLMDLMSELSLLKDVKHPNVIRLLGACTTDGPLYIIVEFCENGSLRNHMRSYHKRHYIHLDQSEPPSLPEYLNTSVNLSSTTLLSFCWQIARGMQHLADMKVVHRDLAARNVLITARNQAKISDFGMSRDVYEADSYLRKSKGRIPVKWMAPESLYDQIYTTKSDVWSYGILVWEIATLGASPYPGIAPERLFELLKTGYRMSKPDHCSDELYAVMQKCWKSEAIQRPQFVVLADIFERILQVDMDYLDLNKIQERIPVRDEYDKTIDGLCPGSPEKSSAACSFSNNAYAEYGPSNATTHVLKPLHRSIVYKNQHSSEDQHGSPQSLRSYASRRLSTLSPLRRQSSNNVSQRIRVTQNSSMPRLSLHRHSYGGFENDISLQTFDKLHRGSVPSVHESGAGFTRTFSLSTKITNHRSIKDSYSSMV